MSSTVSSKIIGDNRLLNTRRSRLIDNRRFRLAPIWPEWNEAEINIESWDAGNVKKKDIVVVRARPDLKTNISVSAHGFEDPEGKVELPPSFKVEQWKRPIEFLVADKSPVIVDPDVGIQNFDLVTPNEHLHHSETMRKIISEITALWDICRKERKNISTTTYNIHEFNITERTWRPWEHIYALNKVSKQPFITPYNPSGKYIVRLFFLGTWRKIIIDDTIPFDSKNRCLLPQTSLSYELWPMLLSKALLKIISLDFNASNDFPESNEASVIHSLTGWIPEPIPLKYTHAGKVWDFLRYDRSNQFVGVNDNVINKNVSSFGPIPLFKWPDSKVHLQEETISMNGNVRSFNHLNTINLVSVSSPNLKTPNDTKKLIGTSRAGPIEDSGFFIDDQMIPEAPKMLVFATIPHLQPTRISSYSETADRSERLRHYNLNDTFSTSVLLTSIRDIPLEPPPPPEYVPPWKLIRPKKPIVLPHAEPIIPHESKPERWIEITSPYINYSIASALNIKTTTQSHPIDHNITIVNTSSRLHRTAKHLAVPGQSNIIEIDEDIENEKLKPEQTMEFVRSTTNISSTSIRKESHVIDTHDKSDDSVRSTGSKHKYEIPIDKIKTPRKSAASGIKIPSDTVSTKSKGGENEHITIPIDVQSTGNNNEQQNYSLSNLKSIKKPYKTPKIWMDFDDFCACFTSIIVFHNPRGYHYAHKHTEIKFAPYQQHLFDKSLGGENEQITMPIDVQSTGNNNEQQNYSLSNLKSIKKPYKTPKIWMDFDDFCACFTSIIVFHNPRGYHYAHKHTEIKFAPYQQPVITSLKEKKKEPNQSTVQIPNLQDDKPSLYLFVDSTRDILDKNIQLIISLTCLSRWYDTVLPEFVGLNEKSFRNTNVYTEKTSIDVNQARNSVSQKEILPQAGSLIAELYSWKSLRMGQPILRLHTTATKAALLTLSPGYCLFLVSQKEILPQAGSLIAELYSWKSLRMGQPILRLHTTATKAALLTLSPGRHVLKLTDTCPFACNVQILSDTNDFMLADEDQLLNKITVMPEDADFILRAEELFLALDDSIQNFHLIGQQENKLYDLLSLYCENAPKSLDLTIQTCFNIFNQALYSTLRTVLSVSGSGISVDTQFAWRCFTNDLATPDILSAYETKRPSMKLFDSHMIDDDALHNIAF
ncbi:unnamed protein product [Rotaria sp. Silwood1]|nr:unnamed protein product [Rotaria sp. Silwood1]